MWCTKGISTTIAPKKKTVITLDLQLYIKAIQLEDKDGKVHVVFAMCHAIGKYIDSSGLYKPFTHCGIYSHLVDQKILDGKNMKRCISDFIFLAIWTASKKVLQNWTRNERN